IRARSLSPVERLERWARRNKGIAAALSALFLSLVVIAVGALLAAAYFQQQEKVQSDLANKNKILAGEKEEEATRAKQGQNQAEKAQEQEAKLRKQAQDAQQREGELRQLAEKRGQELRNNLYLAEMNLAGQAAESPSGIRRVTELLTNWQQSKPDLRGWEW